MSNVIHATVETFNDVVLKSDKPVIVDFWAPWCGPCKALAPVLDEVSLERSDITIVKVDVDENQDIAQKFGVRGIPTLCLFDKGILEATKVGSINKPSLNGWIDSNI